MSSDGADTRLDISVREYLEEVAAPTPAVTGGAVNAVTAASAAGLVSMTARLSSAMSDSESIASTADDLRGRVVKLAESDSQAYAPVLAAQRRPVDDPDRPAALRAAYIEAAQPPLRLAELAAELAGVAADVAARGKKTLRGDAVTAAVLAAGAARASTSLARVNLDAAGQNWNNDTAATVAERHAATARSLLES